MSEREARRVRVVLVSVGMYGQKYLEEMTRGDTGGEVAGIVDVAENLAARFPVIRERGIPVYRSLRDFFAERRAASPGGPIPGNGPVPGPGVAAEL